MCLHNGTISPTTLILFSMYVHVALYFVRIGADNVLYIYIYIIHSSRVFFLFPSFFPSPPRATSKKITRFGSDHIITIIIVVNNNRNGCAIGASQRDKRNLLRLSWREIASSVHPAIHSGGRSFFSLTPRITKQSGNQRFRSRRLRLSCAGRASTRIAYVVLVLQVVETWHKCAVQFLFPFFSFFPSNRVSHSRRGDLNCEVKL